MTVDSNEVMDKLRTPARVDGNYENIILAVKNECLSAFNDAFKNNGASGAASSSGGPPRKAPKVQPIQPVVAYQGNQIKFCISQLMT